MPHALRRRRHAGCGGAVVMRRRMMQWRPTTTWRRRPFQRARSEAAKDKGDAMRSAEPAPPTARDAAGARGREEGGGGCLIATFACGTNLALRRYSPAPVGARSALNAACRDRHCAGARPDDEAGSGGESWARTAAPSHRAACRGADFRRLFLRRLTRPFACPRARAAPQRGCGGIRTAAAIADDMAAAAAAPCPRSRRSRLRLPAPPAAQGCGIRRGLGRAQGAACAGAPPQLETFRAFQRPLRAARPAGGRHPGAAGRGMEAPQTLARRRAQREPGGRNRCSRPAGLPAGPERPGPCGAAARRRLGRVADPYQVRAAASAVAVVRFPHAVAL